MLSKRRVEILSLFSLSWGFNYPSINIMRTFLSIRNIEHKVFHFLILCTLFGAFKARAQTNVLFIGNSYTDANSLPSLFEQASQSAGFSTTASSSTMGGATFNTHASAPQTFQAMKAANWDYVVLQGQSQEPSFPWSQVASQTLPFAKTLVDSIRSIVPCAEPVFFRTWGRENGDSWNCPFFPPLCTYEGMDSLLHLRYTLMADSNEATLSPVGSLWRFIRVTDSTLQLYSPDGSHPSLTGSYAAACTFFSIIHRADPLLINFDATLDSATAAFIRSAAHTVVYDSLSHWRVGANDPSAQFSMHLSQDTVYLSDFSAHADSVAYIFSDGAVLSQDSGIHILSQSGPFSVTQWAYRCGRTDTATLHGVASFFNQPELPAAPIHSWSALMTHWPTNIVRVELYSLSGQLIATLTEPPLNFTPPVSGLYLVVLIGEDGSHTAFKHHWVP